jgi:cation:H+ antiporter
VTVLLFLGGLVGLLGGAELLVRGASRLAAALGLSPLLVGLTVVSLGTSSPEIAVSVSGAVRGSADIALGNVVGSNACNVLLILGASALITPLLVAHKLVRVDAPIVVGASLLVWLLAADGSLSPLDGLLLLAGGVGYLVFLVLESRKTKKGVVQEYERHFGTELPPSRLRIWAVNLSLAAGGLVLLVLGSRALVSSATEFARTLGVSELVIALTVIATGTSLPELATSALAALRGERDIAVGNVIGSNLFNLLFVLGIAGVAGGGIGVSPAMLRFDLPVMVAAAVACLPIFFSGYEISRWEGGLLFGYYLAFNAYVVLRATEHDALPAFSGVMLAFVLPLTALSLAVVTWRSLRARRT